MLYWNLPRAANSRYTRCTAFFFSNFPFCDRFIFFSLFLIYTCVKIFCSYIIIIHLFTNVIISSRNRGSITSGWKEEESCTSELFCVLGRGLPSPKTQNNSRVQDSSSFHPRVIEPLSPTIKRRNLHVLP